MPESPRPSPVAYIVKQGDKKIENNASVCVDVFDDKHCVLEDYAIRMRERRLPRR